MFSDACHMSSFCSEDIHASCFALSTRKQEEVDLDMERILEWNRGIRERVILLLATS
jgi:hypothetical protein